MRVLPVLAALFLVLGAARASAQTIPNLVGSWKSESHEGVTTGSRHFPKDDPGPHFVSGAFVLVIERQEGRRFTGFKKSAHSREAIMGVVGHDGATVHIIEDEGALVGTLTPDGVLELVYSHHAGASRGIGVARYVREAQ